MNDYCKQEWTREDLRDLCEEMIGDRLNQMVHDYGLIRTKDITAAYVRSIQPNTQPPSIESKILAAQLRGEPSCFYVGESEFSNTKSDANTVRKYLMERGFTCSKLINDGDMLGDQWDFQISW